MDEIAIDRDAAWKHGQAVEEKARSKYKTTTNSCRSRARLAIGNLRRIAHPCQAAVRSCWSARADRRFLQDAEIVQGI